MDNFFTLHKLIKESSLWGRVLNVLIPQAFVHYGHQRSCRQSKMITLIASITVIKKKVLYFWWMDNNKVTMASSIHSGEEDVKRTWKKPRKYTTNKHHLPLLSGDKSVAEFEIPSIIDNYNYKMKEVDLSDQFIAHYHPQARCWCNWLAMFFHGLDIVYINSYIVTAWKFN